MLAAAATIGDREFADWLTVGVPGAILRGEPVPPRPQSRPRGRLGRLLQR